MSDYQPQGPVTYGPMPQQKNGMAVAALVLGIISLVLFCFWYLAIPCGILAIIFGSIGGKRAKAGASGGGMAKGGLICGCISVGLALVVFILVFAGCALFGSQLPGFMQQMQDAAEKARQSSAP